MEKVHEPDEQIAERYFLGELTDAEAEAYEAHYFECARCAEYVVEELHLLESGRAVALAEGRRPAALPPVADIAVERKKRRPWIPLAAAAALAVVVAAPLLMRTAGQPATTMTTVAWSSIPVLRFSQARNETAPPPVVKAAERISFEVEVPDVDDPHLELSVRNAANKQAIVARVLSKEERDSGFRLELHWLPAGSYEVVVESVRQDGHRLMLDSKTIEVRR